MAVPPPPVPSSTSGNHHHGEVNACHSIYCKRASNTHCTSAGGTATPGVAVIPDSVRSSVDAITGSTASRNSTVTSSSGKHVPRSSEDHCV